MARRKGKKLVYAHGEHSHMCAHDLITLSDDFILPLFSANIMFFSLSIKCSILAEFYAVSFEFSFRFSLLICLFAYVPTPAKAMRICRDLMFICRFWAA